MTNDVEGWPGSLATALDGAVDDWERGDKIGRLWAGDPTLWTGTDEASWLGWLRILDDRDARTELASVAPTSLERAFDEVLVLGMGGSSLCPEVLGLTFGHLPGAPRLQVLDSTDPAQVRSCVRRLPLERSLVIVSSKSGTTLESKILMQYLFERIGAAVPEGTVGRHFVAVTDPGSELEQFARRYQFRKLFHGVPSIGGRYSALSHFGMAPASAMGVDVERFLDRASEMRAQCAEGVSVGQNPGAMLGLALGVAVKSGRDKLTFVASPRLRSLGTWVEQLLAESTGKGGQGIIPIDGEALAAPSAYGADRCFVYVRDDTAPDATQDDAIAALGQAGFPIIRMEVRDHYDLAGQFFRWEVATAVAGAYLGVNPFDQPDVEASKLETRRLTQAYESAGHLPQEVPRVVDDRSGLSVFADDRNARELGIDAADHRVSVADAVGAHCRRIGTGDYFAVLAYLEMNEAHESRLQDLRHSVREATGCATCLQFGPRFLHSTGQAYKGGPNTGVFLQITCDDPEDITVPGQRYTFGVVKAAQARGDLAVLGARGRRAIRIHVTGDRQAGLDRLTEIVRQSARESG